jgi:hypothetical protein
MSLDGSDRGSRRARRREHRLRPLRGPPLPGTLQAHALSDPDRHADAGRPRAEAPGGREAGLELAPRGPGASELLQPPAPASGRGALAGGGSGLRRVPRRDGDRHSAQTRTTAARSTPPFSGNRVRVRWLVYAHRHTRRADRLQGRGAVACGIVPAGRSRAPRSVWPRAGEFLAASGLDVSPPR